MLPCGLELDTGEIPQSRVDAFSLVHLLVEITDLCINIDNVLLFRESTGTSCVVTGDRHLHKLKDYQTTIILNRIA